MKKKNSLLPLKEELLVVVVSCDSESVAVENIERRTITLKEFTRIVIPRPPHPEKQSKEGKANDAQWTQVKERRMGSEMRFEALVLYVFYLVHALSRHVNTEILVISTREVETVKEHETYYGGLVGRFCWKIWLGYSATVTSELYLLR